MCIFVKLWKSGPMREFGDRGGVLSWCIVSVTQPAVGPAPVLAQNPSDFGQSVMGVRGNFRI